MKSPKRTGSIAKRSVRIGGRRTSIALEDHFFQALKEIAKERGTTLQDLVRGIDRERRQGNLSSVIRVFVLGYYLDQIAARTPRA
jgi:predicted DNA-binding ribbon-helix-helix protein